MEAALDRLVAHSFTLARVSGWICGLLLTVSAFLIGLDILLRETIVVMRGVGANELSGYALAVSSSWEYDAAPFTASSAALAGTR